MGKYQSSLLAGVVGASTSLAGLALAAPCDGRGCLSCARCVGVGAAVMFAALCYRSRRPTTKPTQKAGPVPFVASQPSIADSQEA